MKTLVALLLMSSAAMALDGTPTDDQKVRALREAYKLNGNSMVRWGSIDMTGMFESDNVVDPNEKNALDEAADCKKKPTSRDEASSHCRK